MRKFMAVAVTSSGSSFSVKCTLDTICPVYGVNVAYRVPAGALETAHLQKARYGRLLSIVSILH